MDGNTAARSSPKPPLSPSKPSTYFDVMVTKVMQLPKKERNLLEFDNFTVRGFCAAASAIAMNIGLKRSLLLYEGVVVSAVAVSITALGSNYALNKVFIQLPMFSNPDNCLVCTTIRGGVFQAVSSTVFPVITSIAANAIIADRYTNNHIPKANWGNRKQAFSFWQGKLLPTKKMFFISLGLQTLIGAFYAYRQQKIMDKLYSTVTNEDYEAIASEAAANFKMVAEYNGWY